MAATSFIWNPSYGSRQSSSPVVRSVRFGDGYEQRLSYGLNTDLKTWDVSFDNVSTAVKDQITGFLDARQGVQNFNWASPEGAVGSYVCQQWDVTASGPSRWTITATFREVVDL